MVKTMFLILPLLMVSACSDEQNEVEEHVWKEQTDMIDKAKEVENILNEAALQQQKLIEEQTR